MSTSYKAGSEDVEYVRSFLTEVKSCEDEYGVLIDVELQYTGQRGVMAIAMIAIESRTLHNLTRPIVRYRTQFPGGSAKLLSATLFQGACALSRMVAEYRAAEQASSAPLAG